VAAVRPRVFAARLLAVARYVFLSSSQPTYLIVSCFFLPAHLRILMFLESGHVLIGLFFVHIDEQLLQPGWDLYHCPYLHLLTSLIGCLCWRRAPLARWREVKEDGGGRAVGSGRTGGWMDSGRLITVF
jgi:hypothetical protein